jgi:hypothetical protein
MALFFDRSWFEARLAALNLPKSALGAAAGLDAESLSLIFKDQREVRPQDVAAFASLLGVSCEEAAQRCGVSTRAPDPLGAATSRLAALEKRLAAAETRLAQAEAKLERLAGAPAPDAQRGPCAKIRQPD